jgi:hypothetical protein
MYVKLLFILFSKLKVIFKILLKDVDYKYIMPIDIMKVKMLIIQMDIYYQPRGFLAFIIKLIRSK